MADEESGFRDERNSEIISAGDEIKDGRVEDDDEKVWNISIIY